MVRLVTGIRNEKLEPSASSLDREGFAGGGNQYRLARVEAGLVLMGSKGKRTLDTEKQVE